MPPRAKRPKTSNFTREEVVEMILEDGEAHLGMESDEESEIDREMDYQSGLSSEEDEDEEDVEELEAEEEAMDASSSVDPPIVTAPHSPVTATPGAVSAPTANVTASAVPSVPPGPHVPRNFYGSVCPRPPAPVPAPAPAPVVHCIVRGRGRRRGRGRGHGRGRGLAAGHVVGADPNPGDVPYKTYCDPDVSNQLPEFNPSRPVGIHFGRPLLRQSMTKAIDFFFLFFTGEMIDSICRHTNSYANEHIFQGTHQTYAKADGSWEDVTPDEIKRLIALLIYFGLVKVVGAVEKYWSKKTLYNGLWARAIMQRDRFKASC